MVLRSFFNRRKNRNTQSKEQIQESFSLNISHNLNTNLDNLNNILDKPDDLKIRKLKIGTYNLECAVAYIDGITDSKSIQDNILTSLESQDKLPEEPEKAFQFIYWELISISDVNQGETLDDLSLELLSGSTIIYIDGINRVLIIDTTGGEFRAIEEPSTETLIRGPRVGFVENIQSNLAMIRRSIKDPNLRFVTHKAGRRSKQSIVVTYVDGIVNPSLVEEVNRRLKTLDIDSVPESGYIEEWIEDDFLSPFPQMIISERPDKVTSALLQGKVAIIIDGTPFTIILPVTVANVLQSPEDYYERWTIGSLLRILRYFGAFISIFLPAIYIALISLQPGMIPSKLAFSIAATREGVPFPPAIEAFLMVITFELLQEAGARLPQTIGQTIGIVGGLVIGEAAVQAGIVSPIMVIVIALTAIANFAVPAYGVAIAFRIVRLGFMFAAAAFGLYGIILAFILLCTHLVNLKSFGIPYTTPFAPFQKRDWNDVILRAPITTIKKRPVHMQTDDETLLDTKDEKTE